MPLVTTNVVRQTSKTTASWPVWVASIKPAIIFLSVTVVQLHNATRFRENHLQAFHEILLTDRRTDGRLRKHNLFGGDNTNNAAVNNNGNVCDAVIKANK